MKRKAGLAQAAALAERAATPPTCMLCERPLGARVEWHHLVPKAEGGRVTAPIHPICHRIIHATLPNRDLARDYADPAALRAHPAIARYLLWIADKPPDFTAPGAVGRLPPGADRRMLHLPDKGVSAMLAILLLLQAAAPPAAPPSTEAIAAGRRLAETGTLASLLPMMAAKEGDELVAAHPELSPAEQAELRRTLDTTFQAGRDRLFAAEARAYAERLSLTDMQAVVAFNTSPVATRLRAAQPAAIAAAMGALEGFDLKQDSQKAFCAKTGKACPK